MSSSDNRNLTSDRSRPVLGGLLHRAGQARGRSRRPGAGRDRFQGLDQLEGRILLGGDHPDLILPLTPTSGTLITLNGGTGEGSDTGTIGTNGDRDLFRFTAVADDFVRVWADTVNPGSTLNSRVEVYTIDGPPPIASGSNNGKLTGGDFMDGWAGFVAESGKTYYVLVMSDVLNGGLGATGNYELRIDGKSEGAVALDLDPNSPTYGFGQLAGNITTTGGDQVFTVTADSADAFDSLATFNANAVDADLDTRLDLYDATGKLVAANSESGHLSNAFATFKSAPGALFYVRIRSDEFDIASPTAEGAFLLKVDLAAKPIPLDPVVRRGSDLTGALATTQDSEVYSFKAEGTGRAIITIRGLPIPPLNDPALRVYDSTGKAIAFNKLYGAAEVQITLVGGQTYFLVVEAFDDPVFFGGLFGTWIESDHTFDSAQPVDDHADTPDFDNATPLVWGPAYLFPDRADPNNPVADHSYVTDAIGNGRIQGPSDTDLFSFVPQMDMLGGYGGDDGNQDAALYVGGAGEFTLSGTKPPPDYDPVLQNFLAILDAPGRVSGTQKWWNAASPNPQVGPPDLGLNGAVRAMTVYDPDGGGPLRPYLVAGGDFTMAGGLPANHIARWVINPLTGKGSWGPLGSGVNGKVHALTVWDDDGDGPDPEAIIVGGEFTDKGLHLAKYDGAWGGVGGGVNNTVYALTVFDPPDFGVLSAPVLVVGGAFTDAAKGHHIAIRYYDDDGAPAWYNHPDFLVGTDDIVYALTSFDDPAQDGNGDEIPNKLILGGAFIGAGDEGGASHIASLTIIDDGGGDDQPDWDVLGSGVNDDVYALTVWDRDGDNADDFGPVVVAGGAFTDQGSFIAAWDGAAWGELGGGFDAPVRALTVFTDFEYNGFDVDINGAVHNDPRLWVGGDFETAFNTTPGTPPIVPASHIAKWEINQFDQSSFWIGRQPGSTDTVYALQAFNDETATFWDRADRTSGRLYIDLNPVDGSFLNTFVTVYDSNLDVVYTNERKFPLFPDPSGSQDPAFPTGGPDGIQVWGGETYYIEVRGFPPNNGGTGRYQFTVTADAYPPDLDGDGVYDDTISQYFEPENGTFNSAPEIVLDGLGDGLVYTPINPSAYNGRFYDPTPSGFLVQQLQEDSAIERIDDTDLYLIRAPVTGTIEIRITTTGITDKNYEVITDLVTGQQTINDNVKVLNSPLDSALTVYRNDETVIVTNDTNAAIQGEVDQTYVGGFNPDPAPDPIFHRRDARVVFDVIAGDSYFVRVSSAQKAAFDADPSSVDWRHATGSYQMLVNAEPSLGYVDDHAYAAAFPDGGLEAMIPINEDPDDPLNGTGVLAGVIDNVLGNPKDIDSFGFIAPGAGVVNLKINADDTSTVIPSAQVTDVTTGQVIAQGTAGGDGNLTLHFPALKGDRYLIDVTGAGVTEGSYTVDVSGVPFVDDHADEFEWNDATELTILDFLGSATAPGTIDGAGDTDLFKFTTPGYDLATVTVNKVGGSLDTFVTVFEVSEDAVGNPIHLRIAYNDNFGAGTDSQISFPITAPDRTSLLTGNTYNSYYIMVSGSDRETQSGAYQLTLTLTPTDDHPDAGQFDFASSIVMDPGTGLGDDVGNLEESGDTDLFQFTAPAGGPMTIDIKAIEGSTVRPRIRVFDVNHQPVLDVNTGLDFDDGDDALLSDATFSFNVVRNQTYYVLVEGVAGGVNTGDSGQYTVALVGPTVDDHANITEFSLATPIALNVLTGDGVSSGVIGVLNDTDLFTFTTFNDGTHTVTIATPGSGLVPRIRLYDGAETLFADVTDGGGQDLDGAADGSVSFTIDAGGADEKYYILVSAGVGGDDTGGYGVAIDGQAPDVPPPDGGDDHPDEGEFDLAGAITLSVLTGDGSAMGTVEEAGDTDLFVFSSLAGGKAFVQVVTPEGTLLDAGVKIFGPDRALIVSDTEGVPGANANAAFVTGGPNQLYYVEVEGLGAGVGSYTVRVNTQPEVNYLFFPEGFANANIREYVSIANPNAVDTTYTVTLYYEDTGLAPVVLQSNVMLTAGSRGGLTLSAGGANGMLPGIVANKPYSLVITSDQPLGANFSHYDFGEALGESFSERTSSTWTFARVERLSGFVNDFITFYNPNNNAVTVTLTAYTDAGLFTLVKTVGANRRGGWNLDDETSLPLSAYGIRLTSAPANGGDPHIGIIAALSHYDVNKHEGDLSLGDPDGGSNAGIIPTLTYGPDSIPQITFFNPSNTQVSVTIRGTYINAALPTLNKILTVDARSSLTLVGTDANLISGQPIGLRYTSTGDVTVLARESTKGDSTATQAGTQAASSWFFGDAFINSSSAGVKYFETLNFYNPDAALGLPVTVSLFFNDGTSATVVVNVGADGFAALNLHNLPAILDHADLNFFSIQVAAERPFITSMTHYDLFLGGGWTSSGAPLGLLDPIDTIL